MASRRLRETPRHKLRLRSCYLSAEIHASLRFVCLRTDDAMLNEAHFNIRICQKADYRSRSRPLFYQLKTKYTWHGEFQEHGVYVQDI